MGWRSGCMRYRQYSTTVEMTAKVPNGSKRDANNSRASLYNGSSSINSSSWQKKQVTLRTFSAAPEQPTIYNKSSNAVAWLSEHSIHKLTLPLVAMLLLPPSQRFFAHESPICSTFFYPTRKNDDRCADSQESPILFVCSPSHAPRQIAGKKSVPRYAFA